MMRMHDTDVSCQWSIVLRSLCILIRTWRKGTCFGCTEWWLLQQVFSVIKMFSSTQVFILLHLSMQWWFPEARDKKQIISWQYFKKFMQNGDTENLKCMNIFKFHFLHCLHSWQGCMPMRNCMPVDTAALSNLACNPLWLSCLLVGGSTWHGSRRSSPLRGLLLALVLVLGRGSSSIAWHD